MMGAVPDDMPPPDRRVRQERVLWIAIGTVLLLVGLGTTVASVWQAVHGMDHRRALRATGTPVMATIADRRQYHTSRTDRVDIRLVYDYDGRHVDTWTRCAGTGGCDPAQAPQIKVWIDPANPADFVQDAEDTRRRVGVLSYGVFTLFGAGLIAVGLLLTVAAKQAARRPAPAAPAVPGRGSGRRLGRRKARRPRRR